MKGAVTCESGILGQHIARELRAAKHDVIGLSRSQSGAARLRELGVELLVADLLDRDELLRATAGMNADAAMLTSSMHPSNALAKRELGWTPAYPTYRDGIRAMAPRR